MPKKEVREDTYAWLLALKLYVVVWGVFIIAIGVDIYHAVESVGNLYAGAV